MKKTFLLTILMILNMATSNAQGENHTYATVPTKFVEAKGIKFAYRFYGKEEDIPAVIYPNPGHSGIFQYHEEFLKKAIPFLTKL